MDKKLRDDLHKQINLIRSYPNNDSIVREFLDRLSMLFDEAELRGWDNHKMATAYQSNKEQSNDH
jgi:hypothetical protein